jgi:peptide deformylase
MPQSAANPPRPPIRRDHPRTFVNIVQYPHPTLRYTSLPLRRVDPQLKEIIGQMFDLMYEREGVGLAANQVDLPLQLFVANPAGKRGEGQEWVFINPVLSQPKGRSDAEEGCLSLPSLYAVVSRPERIHVSAYDLSGNPIDAIFDGYLARIIQHESDHLQGMLFIDRIPELSRAALRANLEEFELEYEAQRKSGLILPDDEILRRRKEVEQRYC